MTDELREDTFTVRDLNRDYSPLEAWLSTLPAPVSFLISWDETTPEYVTALINNADDTCVGVVKLPPTLSSTDFLRVKALLQWTTQS